ncbi:putative zinc transporter ZIP11 isoform X2 [Apostichopus japonicus]|uniref:Zinc transporter ZIP11 n=1 Tax=Stichopus japonicus TaxID=307972 RepID=A0A2G8LJR6_STIJA|nr:putative zinc transporter ZIP11 isoform X2 [Apostichopus japonicus]
MLAGYSSVTQALLGTLFTWGLTAAGAALVFVFKSGQRKILDGSLGFAAGVMLAASYWSLLAPAIEHAEISWSSKEWAAVPVGIGFLLGAIFVYIADISMPYLNASANPALALAPKMHDEPYYTNPGKMTKRLPSLMTLPMQPEERTTGMTSSITINNENGGMGLPHVQYNQSHLTWKRILLLIVAITVHNIPEGLAVGVGFGAVGKTQAATFESARNLAIGIGIQNFPEGLAVSLPLHGSGYSKWRSFWYGQLSGMVEPVAGVLGLLVVGIAEPLLPYALSFAAGAMVYVVMDDIIQKHKRGSFSEQES